MMSRVSASLLTIWIGGALLAGCGGRRARAEAPPAERVIEVVASKFEFTPSQIVLRRGVPVVLELRSTDREHGFAAPGLGAAAAIRPGVPTRLRLVPTEAGTFPFHCSVFCGSGHEEMTGTIVVQP
jgi:cytochrome c oxidase subunit 2